MNKNLAIIKYFKHNYCKVKVIVPIKKNGINRKIDDAFNG